MRRSAATCVLAIVLALLVGACGAEPSGTATGSAAASDQPTAQSSPSASVAPKAYTADDLPNIVVSQDAAPEGLTVERGDSGNAALVLPLPPGGNPIDDSTFVDALTTRIGHTMTGGYTSWTALFETATDAERAFDFIAAAHEADAGWNLVPLDQDVELTADGARHYSGPYGPWDAASIYFWRQGNLLLAAIGVGDFYPDVTRTIAHTMDDRAE